MNHFNLSMDLRRFSDCPYLSMLYGLYVDDQQYSSGMIGVSMMTCILGTLRILMLFKISNNMHTASCHKVHVSVCLMH